MKKNKKLFAILTLVAFMMTLMPVMAFAAAPTNADATLVDATTIELSFDQYLMTGDVATSIFKVVDANDSTEYAVSAAEAAGNKVTLTVDSLAGIQKIKVSYAPTDADYLQAASSTDRVAAFSATINNTAPVMQKAEVTAADKKTVKVTFDKAVETAGSATADFKVGTEAATAVTVDSSNAKIVTLTFANAVDASKGLTYTTNDTNYIQSVLAVKLATSTISLADYVAPISPKASADASIIATKDANVSVETDRNAVSVFPTLDTKYAEVDLTVRQANNAAYDTATPVFVWAEQSGKSNQASDAFVVKNATDKHVVNGHVVYEVSVEGVKTINVAFLRAGEYTLKAALKNPTQKDDGDDITSTTLTSVPTFKTVSNKNTIKATSPAQDTRAWTVDVAYGPSNNQTALETALADGKTTADAVPVTANTVATTKVTLTMRSANGGIVDSYPITLSTNSSNIELDKTAITTDYNGQASFNVAGIREGEYKIYVSFGDYESTIKVQVGATSANYISLIKFPSNPIATDTTTDEYADIFRIQLTDANGNIVTAKNPVGAVAATASAANRTTEYAKYVAIVSAPEANKVKNADLYLKKVADTDYYTLGLDNGKKFEAEGDYEIRAVLDNGNSVTINFSVKKFDKAVSLHIEYPTDAVELNSQTAVPDIYFLDANNVMKKANNRVTVAATGYAVAGVEGNGQNAGRLKVKNDEKYIGQTITVTAVAEKENLSATTTLTVADSDRSIKLDSNRGQVNANNRVGFRIVDGNGTPVALGNEISANNIEVNAIVTNTGDADAKVSYSVSGTSKSDLLNKGTGVISLSSNKETTATVQIMVKVTKNTTQSGDNNTGLSTTYYTGTETFTFGAEADKSVVMTIGSKEMVANNVPVTTDVAPFIQDNRTYVPFRALTEAFGAEVEYNAENNTVTTKLDGKTVVLTVGSTVLTVNDKTVTMDVAPFIVDDRVVVPVRFVGEAFGFTVEATQDADTGATASVVFYQK